MQVYKTVFTRPSTAVPFPSMVDGALAAHIHATYVQTTPVKLVTIKSEVSQDLLSLIITRTFATAEDATAFSTDPQVVAWQDSQLASLASNGITRTSEITAAEA